MNAETYAAIARRKDSAISPWAFAEDNPGYVWLLTKQEAYIDADSARDTTLQSTSANAGSVSSSKTWRTTGQVDSRTDTIERAIYLYENGLTRMPRRTTGTF